MVAIAREMEELCPKAIFINYANPMAMVCWAVLRATKIQTVGLCHSVQGTAWQLSRYMGIPYERLVYSGGRDQPYELLPQARVPGEGCLTRGSAGRWRSRRCGGGTRCGSGVQAAGILRERIVRAFLRVCAVVHPAHRADLIKRYGIPINEYIRRCIAQDKRWRQTKREMMSKQPLEVHRSHEYCGYIIHAHETGEPCLVYGNVLNRGIITNLPQGCCVEVPCYVDRNGIQPCHVGDLPPQLAAVIRNTVNVHELTLEAFFTGRKEHVYQAALLDPHAAAELTIDEIHALVDDLFEAHGKMVPKLK